MRGRALQTATLVGLAILVGVPLFFVVLQAVFPNIAQGSFARPLEATRAALGDPQLLGLVARTFSLGACVVGATAAIGVPLGAARGLLAVPFAGVLDVLVMTPFVIPPYLSTLGWILLLQRHGWLDQLIGWSAAPFLFSFWGVVFVMTLNLFPLVYLASSRAVAASGGRLSDVARVFGASHRVAVMRVIAPLSAPAIFGALLLVFSAAIEEYGAPAALAGESGFSVLVTAIDRRIGDYPIDPPGAAILSLALVAMAVCAYVLQSRALAGRSYETVVGKGAARPAPRRGLAGWTVAGLLVALILLAAAAPLFSIAAGAFSRTLSAGLTRDNLSLLHFRSLFADSDGAAEAMLVSLTLAAATALVTGVLGFCAALCARPGGWEGRGGRVLPSLIALLTVAPNATPGVVVAVGLILAWNQPSLPVTVYGSWLMLVLAYSCILLPYPARAASGALRQVGSSLEPAARVCGAGPARAVWRVTLPLIAPGLAASTTIVFAIASRELVASILLTPSGGQTISTYIWRQFDQGSLGDGMAMSLVAISVTLLAIGAASLLARRLRAA